MLKKKKISLGHEFSNLIQFHFIHSISPGEGRTFADPIKSNLGQKNPTNTGGLTEPSLCKGELGAVVTICSVISITLSN